MPNFCTICTMKLFGEDIKPDIDIHEIFNKIPENSIELCSCDNCDLRGISKYNGNLLILRSDGNFYNEYNDIFKMETE